MFDFLRKKSAAVPPPIESQNDSAATSTSELVNQITYKLFTSNIFNSLFDGDKFPGGFGITKDYEFVDYWTLRLRSVQLFTENLYASGLINRLITNIINTGLSLEATPNGDVLGLDDDFINAWSENVENLYRIWGNNKDLVDAKGQYTDGQLQAVAKKTALISGDALVILRQDDKTQLPVTEIIDGRHIKQPPEKSLIKQAEDKGHRIIHGVELDSNDRHVAFYIQATINKKNVSKKIPAYGDNSGRRVAWLIYGTKRLLDDVRGIPLLAAIAQSLKEIDRYRDSEQRAAVINSMIALFIKKTSDRIGTRPLSGGATRKGTETVTDENGETRDFKINNWVPGMGIEELAKGEEPQGFDTKRPNVNFQLFEDTIINAISWACEVPPEILKLAFRSNYSSSRMANSEFAIFLNKERSEFSDDFLKPRHENWLVSMALTDRIEAPGFLESYFNREKFEIFGAWIDSDWSGAIKPHVDPVKEVKSKKDMCAEGFSTRDRSAKELTGMKFTRVARQLKKENELLAETLKPLVDAGLIKQKSLSLSNENNSNFLSQKEEIKNLISDSIEEIMEDKLNQFFEMAN